MKYALLGDLHFGVKGFNKDFFREQIGYLRDEFFPLCKEHNVDKVIQFGDLLDNRKIIDNAFFIDMLYELEALLFEYNIPMVVLTGNHDIYYKNTRDYSLLEVISKFGSLKDKITWINNQTLIKEEIFVPGKKLTKNILIVPWLLPGENIDQEMLASADYVFGHFEIKDFYMMPGVKAKSGLTIKDFQNKKVFSGHYHIRQEKGNVLYLGTPYQLNFGDAGNEKGFYILDLATDKLEFILNTYNKKYLVIWLGNNIYNSDEIDVWNFDLIKEKYYVKIIHRKDTEENTRLLYEYKKQGIDFIYNDERNIVDLEQVDDKKVVNINKLLFDIVDDDLRPVLKELMQEVSVEEK